MRSMYAKKSAHLLHKIGHQREAFPASFGYTCSKHASVFVRTARKRRSAGRVPVMRCDHDGGAREPDLGPTGSCCAAPFEEQPDTVPLQRREVAGRCSCCPGKVFDPMIVVCPPQPCTTVTDLREAEQQLYRLPPLEGLFRAWQTADTPISCPESRSLLLRREQVLGPMTLSAASIALLAELALDCLANLPARERESAWANRPLSARLFRHDASLSAVQTQALLPPHVLVQKTVSLKLDGTCLLCTGAGTYHLTRHQLRRIGQALALSSKAVSHTTINPTSCLPVDWFGMQPGMVSSFLPPFRPTRLTALVLLPPLPAGCEKATEELEQAGEIAISLSLWESLLLPLSCFHPLVEQYCRRACPAVRFISLESETKRDELNITHSPRTTAPAAAGTSRSSAV